MEDSWLTMLSLHYPRVKTVKSENHLGRSQDLDMWIQLQGSQFCWNFQLMSRHPWQDICQTCWDICGRKREDQLSIRRIAVAWKPMWVYNFTNRVCIQKKTLIGVTSVASAWGRCGFPPCPLIWPSIQVRYKPLLCSKEYDDWVSSSVINLKDRL